MNQIDVDIEKIDEIDDKLWDVAHLLNNAFSMNIDFNGFEHSEFSINIREAIIEEMKHYTEDNELLNELNLNSRIKNVDTNLEP